MLGGSFDRPATDSPCKHLTSNRSLHSRQLIHGDVKPGNFLVSVEDGALTTRLIDFGGTRREDNYATNRKLHGTLLYSGPEFQFGIPSTAASDVYSWALVGWEVLTKSLEGIYLRAFHHAIQAEVTSVS